MDQLNQSSLVNMLAQIPCKIIGFGVGVISFWTLVLLTFLSMHTTYYEYKKVHQNTHEIFLSHLKNSLNFDYIASSKELTSIFKISKDSDALMAVPHELMPYIFVIKKTKHDQNITLYTSSGCNADQFEDIYKRYKNRENETYVIDTNLDQMITVQNVLLIGNEKANGANILYGLCKDTDTHTEFQQRIELLMLLAIALCAIFSVLLAIAINKVCQTIRNYRINLYELATVDSLTSAHTRRFLDDIAKREICSSIRHGYSLTVTIFDIDDFKKINDTYGHVVGDKILKEIADKVNSNLRKRDIFCRYGGEEFVILSIHTTLNEAEQLCNRIKSAISTIAVENTNVTCSFGVAEFDPTRDIDFNHLIKRADSALYVSKNTGKDKITLV